MKKPFAETLRECIAELEAGADLRDVLHRNPEHATELRSHLQVWAALSRSDREQATPEGFARGLGRLSAAVAQAGVAEGRSGKMKALRGSTGFSLRLVGALAAAVGLALGIAYFTGAMNEFSSGAEARRAGVTAAAGATSCRYWSRSWALSGSITAPP